MSLKKKDLKMMYSLRWKDDPKREASSFVFVYDIPSITMNFEVFKNYLLKNSGNRAEDISVSYIMDSGKEFFIESQSDFQTALYDFRRNARAGDVIDLVLGRLNRKKSHHSTDAETQSDAVPDSNSLVSNYSDNVDPLPEWFKSAMDQLKQEIRYELTNQMNGIVSDFLESLKLERQLEALELKASQCRERQSTLHQIQNLSDSEAGKVEQELQMNALPINVQTSFPHMFGGELYLHQWEVMNVGQLSWNSLTQLQYSWGSKQLVPLKKNVPVPHLEPGEKGVVRVTLQVPKESGHYECYWQFVHKERRFGHRLGVQVIVDGFGLKQMSSPDVISLDVQPSDFLLDSTCNNEFPLLQPNNTASDPLHLGSKDVMGWHALDMDTSDNCENNADNNSKASEGNNVAATSSNSIKLRDEELDNVVVITIPKNEESKEGFIYVHVDGQKVLIPKTILKSEVVAAAEELERSPSATKTIGVIVEDPPKEQSQVTASLTASLASTHTEIVAPCVVNPPENLVVPASTEELDVSEAHQIELDRVVAAHRRQDKPMTPREKMMKTLVDMGFADLDLNLTLLISYNNDLNRVIEELIR